jgi:DNA-binding protein H-NS
MAKLTDLIAQRENLDKQIAEAQREARSGAIAQIKALMAEHGLTSADLSSRAGTARKSSGSKVAAKYRNKATGETWSGRGLQPRWLKAALASGKKIADFAV